MKVSHEVQGHLGYPELGNTRYSGGDCEPYIKSGLLTCCACRGAAQSDRKQPMSAPP